MSLAVRIAFFSKPTHTQSSCHVWDERDCLQCFSEKCADSALLPALFEPSFLTSKPKGVRLVWVVVAQGNVPGILLDLSLVSGQSAQHLVGLISQPFPRRSDSPCLSGTLGFTVRESIILHSHLTWNLVGEKEHKKKCLPCLFSF